MIRGLVALTMATGTVAIVALLLTIISQSVQRQNAIRDSCRLIRTVVLIATPPNRHAQADQFIARSPLHNCDAYAQKFK